MSQWVYVELLPIAIKIFSVSIAIKISSVKDVIDNKTSCTPAVMCEGPKLGRCLLPKGSPVSAGYNLLTVSSEPAS